MVPAPTNQMIKRSNLVQWLTCGHRQAAALALARQEQQAKSGDTALVCAGG